MKRRKKLFYSSLTVALVSGFLLITFGEDTMSRPDASEISRTPSHALPAESSSPLRDALALAEHPGQSGFRFLATGSESLKYRMALIQAAEKSIDLQYYTIHDDTSANLLLEALLHAASRGVRVRFLIDNTSMKEVGESLSVLDGVKNIEIRVFNPLVTRHQSILSRLSSVTSDLPKAFKRMHNKAIITDNQMAIIGGRNLGDEYFEGNRDVVFKDADILSAGPIVAGISHSFDVYWNGEDSFPISALRKPTRSPEEIEKVREGLRTHWQETLASEDGKKTLASTLPARLKNGEVGLIWAKAELAADDPGKIDDHPDEAVSKPLAKMEKLLEGANKEFIVVSPYFVPRDDGVEWFTGLVKRGLRVRILTNSLAATDVVMVHAGYRRYREALLNGGVELYEMKAIGEERPKQRLFGRTAPAQASLHAKMYVVDRSKIVIGSFNFDPRSQELNTEIALIIYSPAIAEQILKMFDDTISPDVSYQVLLNTERDKNDRLSWSGVENGKQVNYHTEPNAGWKRSLQVSLFKLLPIEGQL